MENRKINWTEFWPKARKVLNVSWKVALVFIGLFLAVVGVSIVQEEYNDHYGETAHKWDRRLNNRIWVHEYSVDVVRVYDSQTGDYVTPKLRWVSVVPKHSSLAVFCDKKGKRGFLNVNTGKIVIEGKYRYAWVFSEGLAAVVDSNGKMGFIDETGKYAIAPKLDYISSHDYVFKHGVCCIENEDEKFGLLNRDGAWILPQEYERIDYVSDVDMFIVKKNDKKGLVRNGSFEWVYPLEYDDISCNNSSIVLCKDYQLQRVSLDGKVVDPFIIDGTEPLMYKVRYIVDNGEEYVISDKVIAYRVCERWGVMDKRTGKVIIPAKYDYIELISDAILKCGMEQDDERGYVLYDIKGNKIQ